MNEIGVENLKFSLVDTDSNTLITTFNDGAIISSDLLAGKRLSFVVEARTQEVENLIGSMRLTYNGQSRVENVEPYALFGDLNGNFFDGQAIGNGLQKLRVEVFSGNNATGGKLLDTVYSANISTNITTNINPPLPPLPPQTPPDFSSSNFSDVQSSNESIATDNEFNGVRLWAGNDISEIDDAASTAPLLLLAKNISNSDKNITGSKFKMNLDGAIIDTDRGGARKWFDDVEQVAYDVASRENINLYSPRDDINVGGNEAQLKAAFFHSLNTAFSNNEQVIVLFGGPSSISADYVSDWMKIGSEAFQAQKAVWVAKGGFSQVTHGDKNNDDTILDYSREPANQGFFNLGVEGNGNKMQEVFEDLLFEAKQIAQKGIGSAFNSNEFNEIASTFINKSSLISLEDQNANDTVRDPVSEIRPTIKDPLALFYATEKYTKTLSDGRAEADFSDAGMVALLLQGNQQFGPQDLIEFTTTDFM